MMKIFLLKVIYKLQIQVICLLQTQIMLMLVTHKILMFLLMMRTFYTIFQVPLKL